jgi:hypothetical protein
VSDQQPNGNGHVRVSFGTEEWRSIPPEVASKVLTLWRDRNPAQFGAYLAEVLTGARPARARDSRAAK